MGRIDVIDRTQLSLFDDNSVVEKYLRDQKFINEGLRKLQEKKQRYEEVRERTAAQIREDYQQKTGKSNPQDMIFDVPELRDRKEEWSKGFYTKNR